MLRPPFPSILKRLPLRQQLINNTLTRTLLPRTPSTSHYSAVAAIRTPSSEEAATTRAQPKKKRDPEARRRELKQAARALLDFGGGHVEDTATAPGKDVRKKLTDEQRRAVELVVEGKNVFLTGSGGVGKTWLLFEIIKMLKSTKLTEVAVTATTGMAAVLLPDGGQTINRWAGMLLGDRPVTDYIAKMSGSSPAAKTWKETDVLVIDEISMLTDEFMDKLDKVGQATRNSDLPFGGLQLIVCGGWGLWKFWRLPSGISSAFEPPFPP
ncbi:PIF1-like helicase-domain-containing protein [Blyttiomyces helicus]|uniref:ATP-dependent DNA helicase n=1 Tax=Blyttiomyces helicus TaxID=388810 RepID=A0A4P9W389_9FUNG|nr:PIF1-like helicase-domain-containing protein [Blyttiomyces helicus]|eukprot:RKO86252.1 PIF1-like helicase-domain-containing protein [Blyttiomyces helicus]